MLHWEEYESRGHQIFAEAEEFHAAHPEVWTMFLGFVKTLQAKGYIRGGAREVWERIRWETRVNEEYETFDTLKCNSNYIAWYVRMYDMSNPQHNKFFRKRKLKSFDNPPVPNSKPKLSDFKKVEDGHEE